jgi:hypothetical protein
MLNLRHFCCNEPTLLFINFATWTVGILAFEYARSVIMSSPLYGFGFLFINAPTSNPIDSIISRRAPERKSLTPPFQLRSRVFLAWSRPFDEPIKPPKGRKLVTLRGGSFPTVRLSSRCDTCGQRTEHVEETGRQLRRPYSGDCNPLILSQR